MRSALITAVATLLASGMVYTTGQPPPPSTLDGPLTVNGSVTMTSGPMEIDGGSSARTYTGGTMLSHVSSADAGTFGTLTCGTASFATPPTGLVRKGVLTRGSGLGLSVGCVSIGTVNVPGVTIESGCMVTYRPTAISFGGVFDCYVTSADTVTMRSCAILALLTAPAGDYGVTLVGE